MMEPLVSVVVPCYNHEKYVQECIQSIIDQNYENIELIIIDDGSNDNSVKKIKELLLACESRFKRFEFKSRTNVGLCATLNEALGWCEGRYFSPIASDDILLPRKIEHQVDFFLNSQTMQVAGVFSKVFPFKEETINTPIGGKNSKILFKTYYFDDIFLRKSKLPAPSAMLVTEKVRLLGGYNSDFKIEDLDMWLKLTKQGDCLIFLDEVLVKYRRHGSNMSLNDQIMLKGVKQVIDCYQEHPRYTEALARSVMVHAGDVAGYNRLASFNYFLRSLLMKPSLFFSRSILVYFYHFLGLPK